jgi:hypothetical protein
MSRLNEQDMRVLSYYAEQGNRELYWNYLARKEGNDGYGLLAMGVVRNDNAPGAVANIYAQNYAHEHNNGLRLSERQWQSFGVDLMRADLAERQAQMTNNRPDLALNLPVRDVQDAHDRTFRRYGIDENAWTPRLLLDASRRHGGEAEAERVWTGMMDNGYLGIGRGVGTMRDAAYRYNDERFNAASYLADVTTARAEAAVSRSNTDPNVIGATNVYSMYNSRRDEWSSVTSSMMSMPYIQEVTDPRKIAELNDARAVRLERQGMRDDFHPQDPNRNLRNPILSSPWTIAENERTPGDTTFARVSQDPVYGQIETHLAALREKAGSESSPEQDRRMALSAYSEVCGQDWKQCSHLFPNQNGKEHAAGTLMIAMRDPDVYDPANPRVYFDAQKAMNRSESDSLQRIEDIQRDRVVVAQISPEQRTQDTPSQGERNAPPPHNRSLG